MAHAKYKLRDWSTAEDGLKVNQGEQVWLLDIGEDKTQRVFQPAGELNLDSGLGGSL